MLHSYSYIQSLKISVSKGIDSYIPCAYPWRVARSFGQSQRDENTAVEMPSKRRKGGRLFRPSLVTPLYVQTDSSEVSVCNLCESALRERFLCRSEQGLRRQASILRSKTQRNKEPNCGLHAPAPLGPVMSSCACAAATGFRLRPKNDNVNAFILIILS